MRDVTEHQWTAVDQYFTDTLVKPDAPLGEALRASDDAGLPSINLAPNQGKLLHLLAQAMGAQKILEIGTLGGYSTIWLARALPSDGRLISLEYEPKHAEVARHNIREAGLAERVEIRVGRALDLLDDIAGEGHSPFDMVFIDADKTPYTEYFDAAVRLGRPGTLIVADNVVRGGSVLDPDGDEKAEGVARFNRALVADARVAATIIQQVGSKGHDGMALAVVLEQT
jgi:predicted O-methyltransferase YrrM